MNQTLNLLNGQAMLNFLKEQDLITNGKYIPFNEAMCIGEATEVIFSDQFNELRCKTHNVLLEEYTTRTIEPLRPLLIDHSKYKNVILWFDTDMFCQINLLTILAYLNQINFPQQVTVNIVDHQFNVLEANHLNVDNYYAIYKQVLLNKTKPINLKLPVMENGIELYLNYKNDENELIDYIRKHQHLERHTLLRQLFDTFRHYGLGDTGYIELINRVKKE